MHLSSSPCPPPHPTAISVPVCVCQPYPHTMPHFNLLLPSFLSFFGQFWNSDPMYRTTTTAFFHSLDGANLSPPGWKRRGKKFISLPPSSLRPLSLFGGILDCSSAISRGGEASLSFVFPGEKAGRKGGPLSPSFAVVSLSEWDGGDGEGDRAVVLNLFLTHFITIRTFRNPLCDPRASQKPL